MSYCRLALIAALALTACATSGDPTPASSTRPPRPELEIAVQWPGGDGRPRCRLEFSPTGPRSRCWSTYWSEDDPLHHPDPGPYAVMAYTSDGLYRSPVRRVTVPEAGRVAVELRMAAVGTGVEGRLLLSERERDLPNHAFRIRLEPLAAGEEPDPGRLLRPGRGESPDSTDGWFSFRRVEPGDYVLGVVRGTGDLAYTQRVTVVNGPTRADIVLPALPELRVLELHPTTPSGSVLDRFDVRVSTTDDPTPLLIPSAKLPGGGRWAELPMGAALILAGKRPGLVWVEINTHAYGSLTQRLEPGASRSQRPALSQATNLDVTVAAFDDLEPLGLKLKLESLHAAPSEEGPWELRYVPDLDDAGTVRFGPLQPGAYWLATYVRSGDGRMRLADRRPIDTRDGLQQTLHLDALRERR